MASANQGNRGFAGALHGLSTLVSLGACVFLAPRVWPLVDGPLWAALVPLYSHQTTYWLHTAGWLAMWPLTFFAARMAISVLVGAISWFVIKRTM